MRFEARHLRPGRDVFRRSNALALLLTLAVLLLSGAAAHLALERVEQRAAPQLAAATERVLASVAGRVAATVEQALDYGIPLTELYGVEAYLDEVLTANVEVASIALVDTGGRTLAQVGQVEPGAQLVVAPVAAAGLAIAAVRVSASDRLLGEARKVQRLAGAAVVVLAVLLALVCLRLSLLERLDLPLVRFLGSLRAVGRGRFADFSLIERGAPLFALGQAAAQVIAPVRRSHRGLRALAQEIRAVDFDRVFEAKVASTLTEVETAFRFEHGETRRLRRPWRGWWAVAAVLLGAAAWPLIGGFAADRAASVAAEPLGVAAAFTAEALGGAVGLLLAATLRSGAPLAGVALLLAGGVSATVFWQDDSSLFLASRLISSLALWFGAVTLLLQQGRALRRPWLAFALLLAGAAAGPALGALAAELLGRRMAFAVTGVSLALLGLVLLPRHSSARPRPAATRPDGRALLGLFAATLAAAAWLPGFLAPFALRYDYAAVALLAAAGGLGAALCWWSRRPLPRPAGPLLAAAGPALTLLWIDPAALLAGAVVLGLGLGTVWRHCGAGLASRGGGLAVAAALLLGPASVGLAMGTALPPLAVAVAVPAIASLLLLVLRPARTAG